MYVRVCMYVCGYVYVCAYMCMCVRFPVYMCVYMCICVCVFYEVNCRYALFITAPVRERERERVRE